MLNQELLKKIVKMLALGTSLSSLAIVKTDKCKRCGKEAGEWKLVVFAKERKVVDIYHSST